MIKDHLTMKRIIYLCEMNDELFKKRKLIIKENKSLFLYFGRTCKFPKLIKLKTFHKNIGNIYYINIFNEVKEKNNIIPVAIILLSDKQTLFFRDEKTTIAKGNLMAIYDTCAFNIVEYKHIQTNYRKIKKLEFVISGYIGPDNIVTNNIILM